MRDWSASPRAVYVGRLDPSDLGLLVSVEVTDLDFIRPVAIRLREADLARNLPHILAEDLSLCYFERGGVVFDRYDPGGTVLQCLDQAERVARDAVRGRLDEDFAAELSSYWGDRFVFTDVADDIVGERSICYLATSREGTFLPVLCVRGSWLHETHARHSRLPPAEEPCTVLSVARRLSLDATSAWPPKTLAELNRWLDAQAPEAVGTLEASFGRAGGVAHWIALRALNGTYLARATLPAWFQKPEFTSNRRSSLPRVLRSSASSIPIVRANAQPADEAYVFGRNMGGRRNLSGKNIALIGCGTIGGFLAHQLAQSGAGAAGGKLVLVDHDKLKTANLGRHLLGAPYLNRNKAEGCRDFLKEQLPMLNLKHQDVDAANCNWTASGLDLVIDATGEEGFSIALNERSVRARPGGPPVLFVWLLGNGAAAQSLSTGDPEFACFKCLKPKLAGEPRFRTLKNVQEILVERNASCGDALYVPFPVSRSVAAAALACDHALDWVNDRPDPRFRSRVLDPARAYHVKDANPGYLEHCPACGARK